MGTKHKWLGHNSRIPRSVFFDRIQPIETDDGKVILNAMNVAEQSNLRNPENPNDTRSESSNYIKDKHYNVSVPLEGDFLRAIHERMGTRVSSGQ